MRYVLSAALAAIAVALAAVPALAWRHGAQRVRRTSAHISLHVSDHNVVQGRRLMVRGRVRPAGAHRIKLVVRGPHGVHVGATSRHNGRFELHWRPRGTGSYRLRAYGVHDRRVRASVSPARRVTAYRAAAASYYGPGLYGSSLACGGTLEPGTLGVAHRTLPCGSRVKLRYRGRSVTVPVVDRGPYVAGREFDLTAATRARLGFPSTGVLLATR